MRNRPGRRAAIEEEIHLGRWSSPAAERRFREAEDQLWSEECSTAPKPFDLETSVGLVRVYHWSGAGDPVVLLHGMGGTAIQWARMVGDLGGHDLYGIDMMGDVGRSVQRVAFRDAAHVVEWLDETIAGLGLDRAHLVGHEYGAFLALNQALQRPERILTITLLDPAGFERLSWQFVAFAAMLEDRRIVRFALHAARHHPARLPRAGLMSDSQLHDVGVPSLLLVGALSVKYDPEVVADRVKASIPDVEAIVIPGAGHALPVDPNADAGSRVRDFLRRHGS